MSNPKYKYEAQGDITTHEVAELLPYLIAEWKDANGPTTIMTNKEISSDLFLRISREKPHLKRHFS